MKDTATTSRDYSGIARVALGFMIAALVAFGSGTALAGTETRESGELLVARGVVVNGTPATGGLTVLSGSTIKTEPDGRAIINLGKFGRVMLGSEAEITLRFTDGHLSGDLISGWALVSAPKGIEIAIKTVDGIAAADGEKASELRIDLTGGTTRVESEAASLSDGKKTEFVAAGEEVELSRADGIPAYSRRALDVAVAEQALGGFGEVLSASVRGAIESVILDRTLAGRSVASTEEDLTRRAFEGDTRSTQLAQQDTTPVQPDCQILPNLIKAKAGCTLGFILRTQNIATPTVLTIKPFMNSACFRVTPTFPQAITINPGQGVSGQINANSCPSNAYQYAQNKLIVVQSNTCGTVYIRVEWATPCR